MQLKSIQRKIDKGWPLMTEDYIMGIASTFSLIELIKKSRYESES